MSTITITFSESVENHVGNQQIGKKLEHGISVEQLYVLKTFFEANRFNCDYYDLAPLINNSENAGILVIKNYLDQDTHLNLFRILSNLSWDKKVKMRGKVVNKHARYNLCFADFAQEPDYENGRGRVYNFNSVNILNRTSTIFSTDLHPVICMEPFVNNLIFTGFSTLDATITARDT